jgi:hypothetical protein
MASNTQKWAYVNFGKSGGAEDYRILENPTDYVGFEVKPYYRNYLDDLLGEIGQQYLLSRKSVDIYVGFDGERYFALRADTSGTDNVNRPKIRVRGYFSQSGDYSDNIPLHYLNEGRAKFGHEIEKEKNPRFNATAYNQYPEEAGVFVRELMNGYPGMKEELIKAGKEKRPIVYSLDGKEVQSLTKFLSHELPATMKKQGLSRTPAPREAEAPAAGQEEQQPVFLKNILESGSQGQALNAILQPEPKDQALKTALQAVLKDKLQPGVDMDAVITEIVATVASSQKGGSTALPVHT